MEAAKSVLLRCATPESIVRLSGTSLAPLQAELYRRYFDEQRHASLMDFIDGELVQARPKDGVFVQVRTGLGFARLGCT